MVHNFSVFFLVCLFVCFFVYFYLLPIRIAKDLPSAFQAYMVSSFTDKDRLTKLSSSFEWILYRELVLKISTSSHNKNCSKSFFKKFELSIFSSEIVCTKQNTQTKLFFRWTKKLHFRLSALVFNGEPVSKSSCFVFVRNLHFLIHSVYVTHTFLKWLLWKE